MMESAVPIHASDYSFGSVSPDAIVDFSSDIAAMPPI